MRNKIVLLTTAAVLLAAVPVSAAAETTPAATETASETQAVTEAVTETQAVTETVTEKQEQTEAATEKQKETETVTETQAPSEAETKTETAIEKLPSYTSADGMYTYSLDENGYARINDLKDQDTITGDLVVPSEIDGHTVNYIGNGAFTNASGITSITIPNTVEYMGDCLFFGCTALSSIILEEGNPTFTMEDGVLFMENGVKLVAYPPAMEGTSYTVPDTVNEIFPGAFLHTKNLEKVTISKNVVSIDRWAFGYSSLKTLVIEDGLYMIDDYAFAYCQSLHTINFGNTLQYIYDCAFTGCRALEEIELPETVKYYGQYCFCDTSMKGVTIPASAEEISYGAFGYNASLQPISTFVIRGYTNSVAQQYCYASDPDNEYQNNFTFIALDANEEDKGAEMESVEKAEPETAAPTEASKPSSASLLSNMQKIILGVGGGIIAVLIVVLSVLLLKKPAKKTEETGQEEAKPEEAKPEEAPADSAEEAKQEKVPAENEEQKS